MKEERVSESEWEREREKVGANERRESEWEREREIKWEQTKDEKMVSKRTLKPVNERKIEWMKVGTSKRKKRK